MIENIEHVFVYCNQVQSFWSQVTNWMKHNLETNILLSTVDILFGIPFKRHDNALHNIHVIVLMAKWYIYRCSLENDKLFLLTFLLELKGSINIEYFVKSLKVVNNPNKWETLSLAI